jgi:hypothetical protein
LPGKSSSPCRPNRYRCHASIIRGNSAAADDEKLAEKIFLNAGIDRRAQLIMGATVGETVKKRGVDFAPYRLNLSLTPQHGSILLEKERIEDWKSCESGDLRLR